MCCDGWSHTPDIDEGEAWGECPDCGTRVITNADDSDWYAASGCNYSPTVCETCGWKPCDDSC